MGEGRERGRAGCAALLQPGEDSLQVFEELCFAVTHHPKPYREKHCVWQVMYPELSFHLAKSCSLLLDLVCEVWEHCDMHIAEGDITTLRG